VKEGKDSLGEREKTVDTSEGRNKCQKKNGTEEMTDHSGTEGGGPVY